MMELACMVADAITVNRAAARVNRPLLVEDERRRLNKDILGFLYKLISNGFDQVSSISSAKPAGRGKCPASSGFTAMAQLKIARHFTQFQMFSYMERGNREKFFLCKKTAPEGGLCDLRGVIEKNYFFFFFFAGLGDLPLSVSRSPTMWRRMKLVAPDLVRVPATMPTI